MSGSDLVQQDEVGLRDVETIERIVARWASSTSTPWKFCASTVSLSLEAAKTVVDHQDFLGHTNALRKEPARGSGGRGLQRRNVRFGSRGGQTNSPFVRVRRGQVSACVSACRNFPFQPARSCGSFPPLFMSLPVRVRFAPSPTGYLHVGGARTALFNWLFARHNGGKFILRIEDTDKERNSEAAVQVIYDGLRWLGLDWDEGPLVGGAHGPYFQSEREGIYQRYFDRLQAGGHVYEDSGAWRFRFARESREGGRPHLRQVAFDFRNVEITPDMTIRRPDGSWIFHFVNVVDDIEMQITHVIRGEDHLSNTPKHLQLYRALGATPPRFAHIPLILNKDGSKMSKRDQGASVASYLEGG